MGEEWGETRPFFYFTDFHGELARQVREGRRNEFGRWESFRDPKNRERIPDPNALSTFEASRLDWTETRRTPHIERLALVTRLLDIRRREIASRLAGVKGHAGKVLAADDTGLAVTWRLGDGGDLTMFAGLAAAGWTGASAVPEGARAAGRLVYESAAGCEAALRSGTLPPWSVVVRAGGPQ
jgi:1,4-alpha-glucan branching enzyme